MDLGQRRSHFDSADFVPEPKQTSSVYGEIEKRLKMRGIGEPSKDLETLKTILEALQLKGLLQARKTSNQIDYGNIASSSYNESPIVVTKPERWLAATIRSPRTVENETRLPPRFRSRPTGVRPNLNLAGDAGSPRRDRRNPPEKSREAWTVAAHGERERERTSSPANGAGQVFKSGPLFEPLRGIGWKSWKKRWFILTRTSLVFFKNDPTLAQKSGEVSLALGGFDLNDSGSVVVRPDKQLLTVLFPDGRNGRAFTLKAETLEDLFEWKTALEHALSQAPKAALVSRNETSNAGAFSHQRKDKRPVNCSDDGRLSFLALEDVDGSPSFLEKALQFVENFGIKVKGILQQSVDVQEVKRRVQEYEQGKSEFGLDEDAHVVAACIKYVLQELPSSPVPASCCIALLKAYKIDQKGAQIRAMDSAIFETFPKPDRRLFQRVLKMMHIISSHSHENQMTPSALAACMSPLLLCPLFAREIELDFYISSDSSVQLLADANAANDGQAIIMTLLEEYENIFSVRVEGLMEATKTAQNIEFDARVEEWFAEATRTVQRSEFVSDIYLQVCGSGRLSFSSDQVSFFSDDIED